MKPILGLLSLLAVSCRADQPPGNNAGSASPAATAAPATPTQPAQPVAASKSDQQVIEELHTLVDRMQRELAATLDVFEAANGDCAKAAAGLLAAPQARQDTERIAKDLMATLWARPKLENQRRQIMDSAFPKELRDRADAVIDPLEKKCADHVAFRDAVKQTGYRKQR